MRIEVISDSDSLDFKDCMEIYTESFPIEEVHSIGKIKERIQSGKESLITIKDNNCVVGFTLLWDLDYYDIVVIDYIAISKNNRDKGIGKIFLDNILNVLTIQNKIVIIEVEAPSNDDIEDYANRRIKFYKRIGFKMIDGLKYLMPSIDNKDEVSMNLMFYNYHADCIKSEEIISVINQIYIQMYYKDPNHINIEKLKKQTIKSYCVS